MKAKFSALAFAIALFAAAPAFASGVTLSYDFSSPAGTLGTSQMYMSNGVSITAFGDVCHASSGTSTHLTSCTASDLYGKQDGIGETGLGLAGEDDHEIGWNDSHHDYILGVDLSDVLGHGVTSLTMEFGSVQRGENISLWGYSSNPFGSSLSLTNNILSFNGNSDSTADYSFTLPIDSTDEFMVVTSQSDCAGDILLTSASGMEQSQTPEPGTLVLLGSGLLSLFGIAKRKFGAA
jgi:PEP-CTERM motif